MRYFIGLSITGPGKLDSLLATCMMQKIMVIFVYKNDDSNQRASTHTPQKL